MKQKEKALGCFEDIDFDSFECSSSFAMHYILKVKRTTTFSILFVSIFLFIVAIPFLGASPIFIFPFLIYFLFLLTKAETYFMKQFASRNNLDYKNSIPLKDVAGNLFRQPSGKIKHVLTGSYENHKTRFFYYSYKTGGKYNKKHFCFTVLEIFFEKTTFPHISLCSAKTPKRHAKMGRGEKEITLEKEFRDTYRLFVKKGYAVEALQIFTPEFLRMLKNEKFNVNIEFKENSLYVYTDHMIKKKKEMLEFFAVSHRLIDNVGPLLNRLGGGFEALHTYFKKS